jgi:hypothetical protein
MQPLRKKSTRAQSPALAAAQRGRPANMQHPSTAKRMAMRKRKKRKPKHNRNPLYKILGVRRTL